MNKLELDIQGMSCGHCVAAVKNALADLPGVKVDDVRIGAAQVHYEPATVSTDQIVSAVEDAGYSAEARTE